MIAELKMAKPAGVKISILSVKRAAEKFAAKEYETEKVFLITKNISDMAEPILLGIPLKAFSVGNIAKREGSRQIKKSVNLTEQDIMNIQEMAGRGIQITAQMLPNESDHPITNML